MNCENCNMECKYDDLFEVSKINMEGETQTFVHFCNKKCIDNFIDQEDRENYSFVVKYNHIPVKNCDLCGQFTHPNEFCYDYGTDPDDVDTYDKFHGLGYWVRCTGNVYSIFLSPNHELKLLECSFHATLAECSFKEKEEQHIMDVIKERYPLVMMQADIDSARSFIEQEYTEGRKENFSLDFYFDYEIQPKELNNVCGELPDEIVIQIIDHVDNMEKLFLPMDITKPTIYYPINYKQYSPSYFIYDGYECMYYKLNERMPPPESIEKYVDFIPTKQ